MKTLPALLVLVWILALSAQAAVPEKPNDVALAKILIDSLTPSNRVTNWPHIGPMPDWNIQVDTYTQQTSSQVIADLYAQACRKAEAYYRKEMKTYTWNDMEGWPRLATVVQFHIEGRPSSFLAVTAYQNNDNDSFTFSYQDGEFNTANKKPLGAWTLPKGLLRSSEK